MKVMLLSTAILLAGLRLAAQGTAWQISGYVRSQTGEALPGALVQTDDSTGVATNEEGFFSLRQPQRPTELAVRRLGYFSRRVLMPAADFQQRKLRLDVVLTAQAAALPEVDIIARKLTILAEEEHLSHIYDYTFAGENLLLLLRDRKQHLIRLVTESGKVLSQMNLPERFMQLHQSCTGGVHLVSEDAAQELIVSDLRLDTFPQYAIQKFKQFIQPCVLEHRGHYFYSQAEQMNQAVRYWYYDPQGQYRSFANICSAAGLREAWKAYTAFLYGKSFVPRPNQVDVPEPPAIDEGFDLTGPDRPNPGPQLPYRAESLVRMAQTDSQIAWLGSLLRRQLDSVYAPLLLVNDTLFLFDHPHGVLRQFGPSFKQAATCQINYADQKGWQKELLKDEATQTVYAHFAPKGRHHLSVINVRTGRAVSDWVLEEVPYISHTFRVRNGFLYYLGRPKADVPSQSLYKLNIRQKSEQGK